MKEREGKNQKGGDIEGGGGGGPVGQTPIFGQWAQKKK